MKSKFFGFNAKLALALLAISGTIFTSCYETEDGDLSLPGKKLPATYTITGQVTDFVTESGIDGASLAFSPAVEGSTTTKNGGYFTVTTETSGAYTVNITASGYDSQSAAVSIEKLDDGKAATYFLNVVLVPEGYTPPVGELDWKVVTNVGKSTFVFDADQIDQVDHVNYHSGDKDVSLKITTDSGVIFENANWADGLSNEFKTAIENALAGLYVTIGSEYAPFANFYKITLPATTSLKSVTVDTFYRTDTYTFKLGDETVTVEVTGVGSVQFDHELRSNAFGHGKGHGHGHGDNLNAGGGIIEPMF